MGYHVEKFTPPLVKKGIDYPIKVRDLNVLKMFRKLVYALSTLVGAKANTLAILFARYIK